MPASQKQTMVRRGLEYGLAIWLLIAVFTYMYIGAVGGNTYQGYQNPYVFLVLSFIFTLLSSAYIIAEPKEGALMTILSRVFIVMGLLGWIMVGL